MSKLLQYLEKIAPHKFTNLYLEQMREARFVPPRNEFIATMRFLKELQRRIYDEPKSFSSGDFSILKNYFEDLYVNSERNYIPLWFNLTSGFGMSTDVPQSLSRIDKWFSSDDCNTPSFIVFLKELLDNKHSLFRFDPFYIEGCTYASNSELKTHSLTHEDLSSGDYLSQVAKMVDAMKRDLFYVNGELKNLDRFEIDEYGDVEGMQAVLVFTGDLHFLNKNQSIYSHKDFEFNVQFTYNDVSECHINTCFYVDVQSLLLSFLYGK